MSLLPAVPVAATVLLMLGGVLTGCQSSPAGPPADDSLLPSANSAAKNSQSLAPAFSVTTGTGSRFLSREHSGEVLVLYFSFPG